MDQFKILFRKFSDKENESEFLSCISNFNILDNIACVGKGDIVIGRYSVLPFYKDIEKTINYLGGKLINSYSQHLFIADFQYYDILKDYTFETWEDYNFHEAPDGEFVVKGKTNSKKLQWNKYMFAPNKKTALSISSDLLSDSLIGSQGILYRRYVPLKTFDTGINDIRFTNEWRFFFLDGEIIDYGYYWDKAYEITEKELESSDISNGISFAKKISDIVKDHVNFFVIDIAQKEDGDWILVEMNDGQMSGLCGIDENSFYRNLYSVIATSQKEK